MSMSGLTYSINSLTTFEQWVTCLTLGLPKSGVIYLEGTLGSGKTTLVQNVLRAQKYQGIVKSPTYTIVEQYQGINGTIAHFDLYRLADPEELEFIGIRDYFAINTLSFIEWPDKGIGIIPQANLEITLMLVPELPSHRTIKLEGDQELLVGIQSHMVNYYE